MRNFINSPYGSIVIGLLIGIVLSTAMIISLNSYQSYKCEEIAKHMQTDWHYSFTTNCMVMWRGQMIEYSKIKVIQ